MVGMPTVSSCDYAHCARSDHAQHDVLDVDPYNYIHICDSMLVFLTYPCCHYSFKFLLLMLNDDVMTFALSFWTIAIHFFYCERFFISNIFLVDLHHRSAKHDLQ